jgi:hypothetical protein
MEPFKEAMVVNTSLNGNFHVDPALLFLTLIAGVAAVIIIVFLARRRR